MRLPRYLSLATLLLSLVLAFPAFAQSPTTTSATERLFTEEIQADWFAPSFLDAVTVPEISALVAGMLEAHGRLERIEGDGERLTVVLERAEVPTQISLDPQGRIAGLLFSAPVATSGTIGDHVAAIAALPGKTAVYVATDGVEVAAHGADEPLAVGSTFKLAILAALRDAIGAGTLAPETVVTLKDEWKSAPTGVLQTWPEGTPLTIAALALEMISISDNTATDALIDIVGRDAIAAKTPRNTPLLKTAEIFKLNAPANAALLAAWQAGDAEARTALLADLAALPLPSAGDITGSPAVAEWFMTAREACALMEQVADEPATRVNPGVAERADWQAIAYKGGSNTGVLNFTTRVIGRDGRTHCISATWNGAAPLDMAKLATPYRGILRALR